MKSSVFVPDWHRQFVGLFKILLQLGVDAILHDCVIVKDWIYQTGTEKFLVSSFQFYMSVAYILKSSKHCLSYKPPQYLTIITDIFKSNNTTLYWTNMTDCSWLKCGRVVECQLGSNARSKNLLGRQTQLPFTTQLPLISLNTLHFLFCFVFCFFA